MCLLVAEILMLAGGMYALIAGKVKLTNSISLEGWRARVAGIFLIIPLPLAFLIGILIGVLIGSGVLPYSFQGYAGLIELLLVVSALIGVLVFGFLIKPKEEAPATGGIEPLDE